MKHIIEFREGFFNKAKEDYQKKIKYKQELLDKLEELTGHKASINDQELFQRPISMIYEIIEDIYREKNTLGLSGKKLAEMLELNVSPIISAVKQYDEYKDVKEPKKEDYTTYAETPDEINRLKKVKKVIDALNDLSKVIHIYPGGIVQATSGAVDATLRDTRLRPNTNWIKGNLR